MTRPDTDPRAEYHRLRDAFQAASATDALAFGGDVAAASHRFAKARAALDAFMDRLLDRIEWPNGMVVQPMPDIIPDRVATTNIEVCTPPQSAPSGETAGRCVWTADDDGNYETACGQMFVLNDGTPAENMMAYCYHCGKPLTTFWPSIAEREESALASRPADPREPPYSQLGNSATGVRPGVPIDAVREAAEQVLAMYNEDVSPRAKDILRKALASREPTEQTGGTP